MRGMALSRNLNFKGIIIIFSAIAIFVGAAEVSQAREARKPNRNGEVKFVPGEYIVKLKRNSSLRTKSLKNVSSNLGAFASKFLSHSREYVLVKNNSDMALGTLAASPDVEYAEPNYIYQLSKTPNDTQYGMLWGLKNFGQPVKEVLGVAGVDIGVEEAWEITTGSHDVRVAVIDTGIDRNHPDLEGNLWTNEIEEKGAALVDDDGNGYVDDIHGYDFVNNDADPTDDHGHGTHCSGTIGAKANNEMGVVGVNWNVKMMALKIFSAEGYTTLDAILAATDYAILMKAHVMSNSWGGGGYSQALFDLINKAKDSDILYVAAAGNSTQNNDAYPFYPATYDVSNILSVAAINNLGELADFSSFGLTTVDVAAPGVNILSTLPGGTYEAWSGTSMATPHVAGIAALLKAKYPEIRSGEMIERIVKTARPLRSLRGKIASMGVANADNSLTFTVPAPDANDPINWLQTPMSVVTPHPYEINVTLRYEIEVPGAEKFAIHFEKFDVENFYDVVVIYDGAGNEIQRLTGDQTDQYTKDIPGEKASLILISDSYYGSYGFDIDRVAVKMKP